MQSIARIMTGSVPHPITGKKAKCYYHLFRGQGDVLYINTGYTDKWGILSCSARRISNSRVNSMKLDSLDSALACREIARAIVSIYRNIPYKSKIVLRDLIISDARYLKPPYSCSFVHKRSILKGTIADIYYDETEGTNKFWIHPERSEDDNCLTKYQGEINIPYMSWRKLGG